MRNHFRGIPRKIYNFRRNLTRNLSEQICNCCEQVVRASCKLLRANCQSKYQHCGRSLQSCTEKNIWFDCKIRNIELNETITIKVASKQMKCYYRHPNPLMVIFNFDVGQMVKIVNIAGKRTLKLVKQKMLKFENYLQSKINSKDIIPKNSGNFSDIFMVAGKNSFSCYKRL